MASQKVIIYKIFLKEKQLFISTYLLNNKYLYFNYSQKKKLSQANLTNLPAVPKALVTMLDILLQKLVGMNLLSKSLTGPPLFNKMRVKFSNATKNRKKKVVLQMLKQFSRNIEYVYLYFSFRLILRKLLAQFPQKKLAVLLMP